MLKPLSVHFQDALDAIEFIAGPPDSRWGAVRAKMGHAPPWNLTYIAVGNEASFQSIVLHPEILIRNLFLILQANGWTIHYSSLLPHLCTY